MTQSTDEMSGSSTNESTPDRHQRPRQTYELPPDTPPDKVRDVLRADIENRLRDVCGNWSTGEFDRVVAEVTTTAMKFRGVEEGP